MKGENINISSPRILVSPLDWGLGHATRCVPVIRELMNQGARVFIGCGKNTRKILADEFPEATFLEIPDYDIIYSNGNDHLLTLVKQIPRAIRNSRKEHELLIKYVKEFNINAVISDNRFGLWSDQIPSVYITHQLRFFTGNKVKDLLLGYGHQKVARRFNEIWIPDDPMHTLSGELSLGEKVKFCGRLSRLRTKECEKDIDWLLLISGPEPQRTIFEQKLLTIFHGKNAVMVRGTTNEYDPSGYKPREVHSLATRELLEDLLGRSKTVVCRSGYSTIMDLSVTGSNVVFVPTPGQPEQQYLARLHAHDRIGIVNQDELSFEALSRGSVRVPATSNDLLAVRIRELLSGLR